jgi:hypothetical protein
MIAVDSSNSRAPQSPSTVAQKISETPLVMSYEGGFYCHPTYPVGPDGRPLSSTMPPATFTGHSTVPPTGFPDSSYHAPQNRRTFPHNPVATSDASDAHPGDYSGHQMVEARASWQFPPVPSALSAPAFGSTEFPLSQPFAAHQVHSFDVQGYRSSCFNWC